MFRPLEENQFQVFKKRENSPNFHTTETQLVRRFWTWSNNRFEEKPLLITVLKYFWRHWKITPSRDQNVKGSYDKNRRLPTQSKRKPFSLREMLEKTFAKLLKGLQNNFIWWRCSNSRCSIPAEVVMVREHFQPLNVDSTHVMSATNILAQVGSFKYLYKWFS